MRSTVNRMANLIKIAVATSAVNEALEIALYGKRKQV